MRKAKTNNKIVLLRGVNFTYTLHLTRFWLCRSAEVSPSATGRTLVGRTKRDRPAEQLRADPRHSVRRLLRRHYVESEHAAERGLSIRERGGAAAQAYERRCHGMDIRW